MTQCDSDSGEVDSQPGSAMDLLVQAVAILTKDEIHIAAAHVQQAIDYLAEREIAGL